MSPNLLDSGGAEAEATSEPGPRRDDALRVERERIARDLHDHVIQRLFAAGLATQRVARGLDDDDSSTSLDRVVAELDDAMREIRATVFDLAGPLGPERGSVSDRLRSVAQGIGVTLGFDPTISVRGPVDRVPEHLVPDLAAVVREGLTNAARHARAHAVDVEVVASSDAVVIRVRDDGVGLGGAAGTSGLANLRVRAERAGGSMRLIDGGGRSGTGMCLLWSVPLG